MNNIVKEDGRRIFKDVNVVNVVIVDYCIYCGLCEEVCPVDSIVETPLSNYHFERRGENIMTKEKLLAVGDWQEEKLMQDRLQDQDKR